MTRPAGDRISALPAALACLLALTIGCTIIPTRAPKHMRRVIEHVPVPPHWESVGVREDAGGTFMVKERATYIRYFKTEWNQGAECEVAGDLFDECSMQRRGEQYCSCAWTLPDPSIFADRSVPRYDVGVSVRVRTSPEVGGYWESCDTYKGSFPPRMSLCRVALGETLVALLVRDRFDQR